MTLLPLLLFISLIHGHVAQIEGSAGSASGTHNGEAQAAAVVTVLDRLSEILDGLFGGAKGIVEDRGVAHEVFGSERGQDPKTAPLPQQPPPIQQQTIPQQSLQDLSAPRPGESGAARTLDGAAQAEAVGGILDGGSKLLDGMFGDVKEMLNKPGVAKQVFESGTASANPAPVVSRQPGQPQQQAALQQAPSFQKTPQLAEAPKVPQTQLKPQTPPAPPTVPSSTHSALHSLFKILFNIDKYGRK